MIYKVTFKELNKYVDNWCEHLLNDDRNLLYAYNPECKIFVGVDNSTDNCWVEEFKTEKDCIKWLKESN